MTEPSSASAPGPVPFQDDLRQVERASFGAWPALMSATIDGWKWRFSGGGFGRSNSVFTLDFSGADVDAAIDRVEQAYRQHGRRARFRLSDVSEPAGLQQRLEARDYHKETTGLIMAKPVSARKADLTGVEWSGFPTPNWLRIYAGVLDEPRQRTVGDILAAVPQPRAFVQLRRRGLTFSCGLGTIDDGVATIECIATREEARRRGGARAMLAGVECWAAEEGAHTLVLNVSEANRAAVALYARAGFEEVGRFAYWVPDAINVAPDDDGAAQAFRKDRVLPAVTLSSTSGETPVLTADGGRAIVVIYPWTGASGLANPIEWDEILGAHGSTPELDSLARLHSRFSEMGVRIVAISGQTTAHQQELSARLQLPFEVLSDADGKLREAWQLPVFQAGNWSFLRRITLMLEGARIINCFYPIHPPADHAKRVLEWLAANPR